MIIKSYNSVNEEMIRQIRDVVEICKAYDGTKECLSLDTSLNVHPEMNSVFLLYEDNRLVSVLSIFMPMAEEAEIYAYTLPAYRQRGCLITLLKNAEEEIKKYGDPNIIFVTEAASKAGTEVMKKLNAELIFTEYLLRYQDSSLANANPDTFYISLQELEDKDMEAAVAISQEVFNDTYEDAKNLIRNTLNADNRTQYIVKLDQDIIGMGSVCIEHDEASVCGLGILPEQRGKGYGREMLNLIILELKQKGVREITLEVESNNNHAFHLYQKCGFVVETSFDYYKAKK